MNLIPFQFENASIRVVEIDGEPWFVGVDIARLLGYVNPNKAFSVHCKGVEKHYPLPTNGGPQMHRVLAEPDLMRLIIGSNLPAADRMERWVFEEVLPTIRKTGSYNSQQGMPALNDPAQLRTLLLGYTEKVIALEATVAEQAPKVAGFELIAEAHGAVSMRDAAKALSMRPSDLIEWLYLNSWIFRPNPASSWRPYQHQVERGLLVQKVGVYGPDEDRVGTQTKITPKGLAELARKIAKERLEA